MAIAGRTRGSSMPKRFGYRLVAVWVILVLIAIGLVSRLFYLQVTTAKDLRQKATEQQVLRIKPFAPRRSIVDRHGTVLALDKPVYNLFAHPYQYKAQKIKPEEIVAKLAPVITEIAPTKLQTLLNSDTTTVAIAHWLPESVANRVRKLGIEGLELVEQNQRFYPQQNLAAEILGYVNFEQKGQAGLELSQERHLVQESQTIDVTQDGRGRFLPTKNTDKLIHPDRLSLQLTIDENLQRLARQSLQESMKKYHAKRGTVLVLDAHNGEIPVLVTEPTYDPNQYYKANFELFKNWAVQDLYEPGSTFKPINVAIALEAGVIQADTVFNDEGSLTIGGWQVANFNYESAGGGGALTISQILERSSNVGMVHIIQQMKPLNYYNWLRTVGLGSSSGIDLPAEPESTLKPKDQFLEYVIEPATASFGQGLSLTPIQMLQMQGILASGGKLLTPHVVRGLIDENGEPRPLEQIKPSRQVLSPATTAKVIKMMTSVVQVGTGKPARIPGYRFGGKTGTAQKSALRGYSRAKITSFVGIFPSEQPRYVVLAVVDEPIGADAFGSTVAAPIVKSVIEGIIAADQDIRPSHPEELITKPN